jgi:hypothetical protein
MFAKAMKSDPEFIGLVAEMKQDIVTAWFNTQPTRADDKDVKLLAKTTACVVPSALGKAPRH